LYCVVLRYVHCHGFAATGLPPGFGFIPRTTRTHTRYGSTARSRSAVARVLPVGFWITFTPTRGYTFCYLVVTRTVTFTYTVLPHTALPRFTHGSTFAFVYSRALRYVRSADTLHTGSLHVHITGLLHGSVTFYWLPRLYTPLGCWLPGWTLRFTTARSPVTFYCACGLRYRLRLRILHRLRTTVVPTRLILPHGYTPHTTPTRGLTAHYALRTLVAFTHRTVLPPLRSRLRLPTHTTGSTFAFTVTALRFTGSHHVLRLRVHRFAVYVYVRFGYHTFAFTVLDFTRTTCYATFAFTCVLVTYFLVCVLFCALRTVRFTRYTCPTPTGSYGFYHGYSTHTYRFTFLYLPGYIFGLVPFYAAAHCATHCLRTF